MRKGRDMVNITGEKLHLNHVLHAVRAAERATGLGVWQFRLVPDVETSRYDLLVELPRPVADPNALADFVAAFDRGLGDVTIAFHWVLATYLFTLGSFYARPAAPAQDLAYR